VLRNDYGDLIERWKVDLIRGRAKRFGFRDDDIPDLEQVIVMELLGVDYDADLEGGAAERTFVIAVIDRQLREIRRRRGRHVRRAAFEAQSLDAVPGLAEKTYFRMRHGNRPELRLDLEQALMGLTPAERAVCEALHQGLSQAEIARERHCSRAAVCKHVGRVAEKFRRWGLDAYLPGRKKGAGRG
jgi:RNA polymerase sigma factor (sigma-70 family)